MAIGYTSVPNKRNAPNGRWYQSVTRNQNANRLTAGQGIRLTQTPTGTTISATAVPVKQALTQGGDGSGVVVAKILGGTALDGFSVECYPNYPAMDKSYMGTLVVMEMALGGDFPPDTLVLAHKMAVTLTGGE